MAQDELLRLGRVSGAVGLKGEIRVYPYADGAEVFAELAHVKIDGRDWKIVSSSVRRGQAVVKLAGIDDRTTAERMAGQDLYVARMDAPALPPDTYYVRDLLGLTVVDETAAPLGKLAEVILGPAQDLYRVERPDGRDFLVPAVDAFVRKVDLAAGTVTVSLIEGLMDE